MSKTSIKADIDFEKELWDAANELRGAVSEKTFREESWNWKAISENPDFPWTVEVSEKFTTWDHEDLSKNKGVYKKLIMPYLNSNIMDQIFLNYYPANA